MRETDRVREIQFFVRVKCWCSQGCLSRALMGTGLWRRGMFFEAVLHSA